VVDLLLDRLGAELGDRVARVDAFRAALIAEVAARAVPDPVLVVQLVEPLDRGLVARVADEAHALRERGRPAEVRVGLHRVALGDAAAAHDAERFLLDHAHLLLGDDPLALGRLVVPGVKPGLDVADLLPERAHVDDKVLDNREVPHRRDHRDVAALDDRLHPLLAGEDRSAVHAHPAGAADHHPAALTVGERHVEQARPFGRLELVADEVALAVLVDAPDLERDIHRRPVPGVDVGGFGHFLSVVGTVSVGEI
jgi:hypothetical protein